VEEGVDADGWETQETKLPLNVVGVIGSGGQMGVREGVAAEETMDGIIVKVGRDL